MPSLFRKKSTKPVPQPDQTLQSKAALYDELVAYLQKASSQLASCTDATSADQASHEWRYLANTPPPPSTSTADDASDKHQAASHAPASPVADLAKILADALTTRADLAGVKDRLSDTIGELDRTRHALAAAQADIDASKSAATAETEAIKLAVRAEVAAATQATRAEADHLRTSLDAAWQLVELKAHALAGARRELAHVSSEARELKQRVEFLEAVGQAEAEAEAAAGAMASAAAGDARGPSKFKIVVSEKSGKREESAAEDAAEGKRGLVAADSTATMVEEEEREDDSEDTRSMGVQTPTPAKMRGKVGMIKVGVAVVVPRIVVKNVNDEIVVGAGGSDEDEVEVEDEFEMARLVPLL